MKVTQHIENAKGETLFSFEIIPPHTRKTNQELFEECGFFRVFSLCRFYKEGIVAFLSLKGHDG